MHGSLLDFIYYCWFVSLIRNGYAMKSIKQFMVTYNILIITLDLLSMGGDQPLIPVYVYSSFVPQGWNSITPENGLRHPELSCIFTFALQ